jgi:hypothetical protein
MRTFIAAIAAVAVLAAPAYAQKMRGGKGRGAQPQQTEEQKKAAQKLDKDYKAALDSIPNQKKIDPWGGVRVAPKAK